MIGQSIHGPITGSPDYLEKAHPNRLTVIYGVLVELVGVLAIPLIAVYVLPILREHSRGLSVGMVFALWLILKGFNPAAIQEYI